MLEFFPTNFIYMPICQVVIQRHRRCIANTSHLLTYKSRYLLITLQATIAKSYPSFPSADGGLIAGADVDLFMVRVEGRLCCLDSMLVNNLAATSRSKHQLKHTIISSYI